MIHLKTNPTGIDIYVQRLQTRLYNLLASRWPNGIVHESFGLCSQNYYNNDYYALIHNPSGSVTLSTVKKFVFFNATRNVTIEINKTTQQLAETELADIVNPSELNDFILSNTINNYVSVGDSDYVEALWDDNKDVVSFFGMSPAIQNKTHRQANVHLCVFVNLKRLKPSVLYRAEDEIRSDYMNILGKALYGFHYKSIETGVRNVLREYPGSAEKLKRYDMHPNYFFRINFQLSYNQNFSETLKLNNHA